MIFDISLYSSCFILGYVIYKSYEKKSLFNAHLIYWVVTLYTVYMPAFFYYEELTENDTYNMIFLLGNIGAFISLFVVPIRTPVKVVSYGEVRDFSIVIKVLALIYVIFLTLSVLYLIKQYGGIVNALTFSRLDAYLKDGITTGAGFKLLLLVPEICYFLLISLLLNRGQVKFSFVLAMISVIYYVFTANTRLPIIFPLIVFATIYIYKFQYKNIRLILPVALISGMIFVIGFSVVGSYLRNGQLENMELSSKMIYEEVGNRQTNQLGYYEWIKDLKDGLDDNRYDYEYGMGTIAYPIISFVPRAFWSEKPNTSSSNRLTELVYERKIGDGLPIYTFHLVGDGFFQFSWLGALLYPFLYIFLVSFTRNFIALKIPNSEYWQAYFLISCVPFVRAELPMVKVILTVIIVMVVKQLMRIRM